MKLRTQEVRDRGPLDLEETVPAEGISLDASDQAALSAPVRLSVHAEALDDEILALIKAETRVALGCARCLERFERPLKAHVELHAPFALEEVEILEESRQSLMLALPLKPLCRPDCKGLCPRCGKNLNEGACACPNERGDTLSAVFKDLKLR